MDSTGFDLVIRNLDTGMSVVTPVWTRIVAIHPGKAELVFNKVDDKSYLTEVIPAVSDGFKLADIREIGGASTKDHPKSTVAGEQTSDFVKFRKSYVQCRSSASFNCSTDAPGPGPAQLFHHGHEFLRTRNSSAVPSGKLE